MSTLQDADSITSENDGDEQDRIATAKARLLTEVADHHDVDQSAVTVEMLLDSIFTLLKRSPLTGPSTDRMSAYTRDRELLAALLAERSDDPDDWMRALWMVGPHSGGEHVVQALAGRDLSDVSLQQAMAGFGEVGLRALCESDAALDDDVLDQVVKAMPLHALEHRSDLAPRHDMTVTGAVDEVITDEGWSVYGLLLTNGRRMFDDDECVRLWEKRWVAGDVDPEWLTRTVESGQAEALPVPVIEGMHALAVESGQENVANDLATHLIEGYCVKAGVSRDNEAALSRLTGALAAGSLDDARTLTAESDVIRLILAVHPNLTGSADE